MSDLSSSVVVPALLTGGVIAVLYLTGLAVGIRVALRSRNAVAVLLVSAAVRIALLLAVGFFIAKLGTAALSAYALGFLIVRLIVVAALRPHAPERGGSWN